MITATGSESRIESYLARVRAALRGLPERETEDILGELRSHVVDLAGEEGEDIEAALASLGDPVDLAKKYRNENSMTRAECSSSPLVILQGLRHASRSRWQRVTVTALYFFGYANVLSLWAAAIEKVFAPSRTGLWYTPGNLWPFTLVTDGQGPAAARELLGWWLIPAFCVLGWVLHYLIDQAAQWWIRRYRRSRSAETA